jgi:hypothetical protein
MPDLQALLAHVFALIALSVRVQGVTRSGRCKTVTGARASVLPTGLLLP